MSESEVSSSTKPTATWPKYLPTKKPKDLAAELVSIQILETELQSSYIPKLNQILSPKKVLLYMQIENKILAAIKYGLAAEIPLAE